MVKNPPWVQSLGREDPLEKGMSTQSSILGEFYGQRSLAGYSPWGRQLNNKQQPLPYTAQPVLGRSQAADIRDVSAKATQVVLASQGGGFTG